MTNSTSAEQSINKSMRKIITVGLCVFLLFLPAIILVSIYFQVEGAVVSQGTLVIDGKPKVIQHLDGGIVSEINFTDGDIVSADDILLKLDDVLLQANVKIYSNRLREALAKKARLTAERDDEIVITWDDEILKLLSVEVFDKIKQAQQRLFEVRKDTVTSQLDQLKEQEAQFSNQIDGVKAVVVAKKRQLELVSEELKGVEKLLKKKNVTLSRVMLLQKEFESLTGEYSENLTEIARIKSAGSELKIKSSQLVHEFREAVLTEFQQVDQEINDMTQQLYATKEQLARTSIKSPVAGIVHDSEVFTVGGVIEPGKVIMKIIPQDIKFIVEARVETQFIDDLFKGQDVRIRFTSFNQRQTPELLGSVKDISASTFSDEQTGLTYYIAKVSINDGEITKIQGGRKLISGMMAEVYIRTDERSIASYLFKPFADQLQRSMREE